MASKLELLNEILERNRDVHTSMIQEALGGLELTQAGVTTLLDRIAEMQSEILSQEEVEVLHTMHTSEAGRSLMRKQPELMKLSEEVGVQWMLDTFPSLTLNTPVPMSKSN